MRNLAKIFPQRQKQQTVNKNSIEINEQTAFEKGNIEWYVIGRYKIHKKADTIKCFLER